MKRLIAIAATGIYLSSVFPGTIWADGGGGGSGGIGGGGTHSSPGLSDTGDTGKSLGKGIFNKDIGIKDDSLKSKAKDVTEPLKRDIPNPGEIFED